MESLLTPGLAETMAVSALFDGYVVATHEVAYGQRQHANDYAGI